MLLPLDFVKTIIVSFCILSYEDKKRTVQKDFQVTDFTMNKPTWGTGSNNSKK